MKRCLFLCGLLLVGCFYKPEAIVKPTRETIPIKVECDVKRFSHIEIEAIKMGPNDYQYTYKCNNVDTPGIYFVVKE